MPEIDPNVLEEAAQAVSGLRAEIERMGGLTRILSTTQENLQEAARAEARAAEAQILLAERMKELGAEVAQLDPAAVGRQVAEGMGEIALIRVNVGGLEQAARELGQETRAAVAAVEKVRTALEDRMATVEKTLDEIRKGQARGFSEAAEKREAARVALDQRFKLCLGISGLCALLTIGVLVLLLFR